MSRRGIPFAGETKTRVEIGFSRCNDAYFERAAFFYQFLDFEFFQKFIQLSAAAMVFAGYNPQTFGRRGADMDRFFDVAVFFPEDSTD